MKIKLKIFIFIHIFLLTAGSYPGSGQPVQLPLDHWLYPFLERLELRGAFSSLYYRSHPLFRREIAELIECADRKLHAGELELSPTELSLLEKAKGEMKEELAKKNISINPAEYEHHIFRWSERESFLYADGYFREEAHGELINSRRAWENAYYTSGGGIIRGVLENKIGFYLDFRNTLIKGDDRLTENFSTSRGLPISISGDNASTTQASAYFTYQGSWGSILLGRDDLTWGPSYRNNLMFSRNGLVFDQIRFDIIFKLFKFTSVHGTLNNDIDQKNIAAHRLEIRPHSSLIIGASESVIYGRRGWKVIYFNPIMPYHIAEQHTGDKDNNTITLDFQLRIVRSLKLYGEWFIDDFSLSESWSSFYGNKFAFVLGGYLVNPLHIRDTDVRFEYARIDPFVYTHQDPINQYTNYNRILGNPMGPNSESFYLDIARQISRSLRLFVSFERKRKGKGDVTIPHMAEDGEKKNFLKGIVEGRNITQTGFSYELYRDFHIGLNYGYVTAANVDLVRSSSARYHVWDAAIRFNY